MAYPRGRVGAEAVRIFLAGSSASGPLAGHQRVGGSPATPFAAGHPPPSRGAFAHDVRRAASHGAARAGIKRAARTRAARRRGRGVGGAEREREREPPVCARRSVRRAASRPLSARRGRAGGMEAAEKQHLLDGRRGVGSYTRSLWQDKAGWFPQLQPAQDFQAVELAAHSNHYCHAQENPSSHYDPKKERARRQLYVASAVCLVFMIGEVIGGYLAHSLAIMTDAAHLLTDFASMFISLFSLWMSSRPATKTMNFGWQRAEILGALLSVLSIWVVTGVLVYLAVERLISGDYEIEGGTMLITSGSAVVVNIIMGLILYQSGHGHSHGNGHSHDDTSQQQENPSVRAAFIHVIGDFLQSLGVLVAAYILYFKPEYKYVDPICTFIFSILVLGTTLTILRDVILILMEGTPKGVNFTAVRDLLLSVEGVEALHSLHIWALTVAHPVLSVHIAIAQNTDAQAVLKVASTRLQGKFHFHTMTIQIENYSEDMKDCQACQGPAD
ncbi:proton-coupled zinc antiporter SLC30A2 isoform X1 [Cavia porcellus]|uniref:proton-coupled zinc antiporter SLC30A2 isoform X1 n=2 Tax=Cavia porcellus TaxID=10141 RepID=UPI002FE31F2C